MNKSQRLQKNELIGDKNGSHHYERLCMDKLMLNERESSRHTIVHVLLLTCQKWRMLIILRKFYDYAPSIRFHRNTQDSLSLWFS